jgi:hypothetical protein
MSVTTTRRLHADASSPLLPAADATERRAMTRQRLSNRRASVTFDIASLGLSYTVTVSHGAGEPREVFITNHKAGSAAGSSSTPPRPRAGGIHERV